MPKMSDLTEEAYGVKERDRERERERTIKFLVPSEKLLLFLKREFFLFSCFWGVMRLRFEYSYDIIIKYGHFINQHNHSIFLKYLIKFIWSIFSIKLVNKEILPNSIQFKSFHKNSEYVKYILIQHCKNPCRVYCKTKENNIIIISS